MNILKEVFMRNAVFDRSPVWNMLSDMDEMFERIVPNEESARTVIPYDMQEGENGYLLSVDLPGVMKDDLNIEVTERVMTLSGERKTGVQGRKFFCRFLIPESADTSKIEASLENGVLEIGLPKLESSKPRNIQIKVGDKSLFSKLLGGKKHEPAKEENKRAVQVS
jgi:HSP20 family molecular chaperone IbpA